MSEKHELIGNRIFQARVCSEGTWDEALEWIRQTNPAGTQNNWQKHKGDAFIPVKCSDNPDRWHFMFEC